MSALHLRWQARGVVASRLAARRAGGGATLGLLDQALISGSNFITMVALARSLGPAAFGAFTLAYSALLYANSLQGALITQPHNVLGASREAGSAEYRRLSSTAARMQLSAVAA